MSKNVQSKPLNYDKMELTTIIQLLHRKFCYFFSGIYIDKGSENLKFYQ